MSASTNVMMKYTHTVRGKYILKLNIFLNTVLAICPFKAESIQSTLYASVILGAYSCLSVYSLTHRLFFYPLFMGLFERFLVVGAIGAMVLFYLNFLHNNIKCRKSWKMLLTMFVIFDKKLPGDILKDFNKILSSSLFVLLRVIPIAYSINDCIIWRMVDEDLFFHDIPFHITQHSVVFYDFQVTCFFWEIARLLESRYKHLEDHLDIMLSEDLVNHQFSHYRVEIGIKKIKHKFNILHRAVEEVNIIFGRTLFFMFIHLTVVFLLNFYWMIASLDINGIVAFEGILFAVMVSVSISSNVIFLVLM